MKFRKLYSKKGVDKMTQDYEVVGGVPQVEDVQEVVETAQAPAQEAPEDASGDVSYDFDAVVASAQKAVSNVQDQNTALAVSETLKSVASGQRGNGNVDGAERLEALNEELFQKWFTGGNDE